MCSLKHNNINTPPVSWQTVISFHFRVAKVTETNAQAFTLRPKPDWVTATVMLCLTALIYIIRLAYAKEQSLNSVWHQPPPWIMSCCLVSADRRKDRMERKMDRKKEHTLGQNLLGQSCDLINSPPLFKLTKLFFAWPRPFFSVKSPLLSFSQLFSSFFPLHRCLNSTQLYIPLRTTHTHSTHYCSSPFWHW